MAYAMTGSTWVESVVAKLIVNGVEQDVDSAGEPGRTEIVEENDRIYFIDGDVKFDITEDMADGQAFGNYEKDGMVYEYEVKEQAGVPGCYELHITSEEQ